jgi:hypothetical protein
MRRCLLTLVCTFLLPQPRLQRGIVRLSFSQLLSDAPIFLGCSASAIQQVLHSNYQQRMATLKIMNLAASRALLARSICLDPDVTRIQVRLVKEFQLERTLRQREQLYPSKRHAQKSGDKEDADAEEDTPINLRKRRYSAAAAAAGGVSDEPDIFDAMLDALKHFLQVQQRHIFLPDKAILELMKTRRLTLPWRRLVVELDGVIDGLEAKMRTEKEMQIVQQVFTTAVEMIVEEESIKLSDEFLDPTSPDAVEIHFSHIGSPMTLARLYQMATGDAKARESLEQQLGQMVTMRGVITQHSQVFLLQKYEPMHCKYDNCALVGKVFLIEIGCTITCVECSQRLVSISRRVYSERDRRVCGLYRECQTLALSSRGQTNFAEEMRQFQVQLSGARDVGKFMTGDHVEVNGVITARDGADGSRLLIFIAHHIRRLDVTWTDHLQQKADLFRKQIAVTVS